MYYKVACFFLIIVKLVGGYKKKDIISRDDIIFYAKKTPKVDRINKKRFVIVKNIYYMIKDKCIMKPIRHKLQNFFDFR